MKKFCIGVGISFIVCQVSLIALSPYVERAMERRRRTMSDLTSLMTPFYEINRSSTFCCSETTLRQRYKHEFQQLLHHHLNQSYEQPPNRKHSMASPLPKLPYFYSLWKTSRLLPRLITPCEHQVYIKLLKTLHDLCESNGIQYMISHGTLLGSYRNHGKFLKYILQKANILLVFFLSRYTTIR